jgi:cobalt-zinc-cadmium efflux system membrane fusion protein
MNKLLLIIVALFLAGCHRHDDSHAHDDAHAHGDAGAEEPAKGPNRGRLLVEGPFAIELAIFETGVPPEYHAWPTLEGKPLPLEQVALTVALTRLGGKVDTFAFSPEQDYLKGNGVVTEPHSFVVDVKASYQGKAYSWSYESFEGRTTIDPEIAQNAGIQTETAGPATLVETVTLYGRVAADPARQREVTARFPGVIKSVARNLGDTVRAGETLAVVESNDSLQSYAVPAPIGGIITQRAANAGEQSSDRVLFTVTDPSAVWAELSVFPRDRARIKPGAAVSVAAQDAAVRAAASVARVDVQAASNQAVLARATLDNRNGDFPIGSFVTAEVAVAQRDVPLAVKASALQPFRDFTVVFEQVGDTYEVRMLELGQQSGEWVEVLGGIAPGGQYVTSNSYILKADVEKSGASHDH